jgi:transcriptional regulator with XRE-family HTH domain/SAM-dependent methyltransferase
MNLPTLLEQVLSSKNMSQEELAELLSVSDATVARWVNGESKPRPIQEGKLRSLLTAAESDLPLTNPSNTDFAARLNVLLGELRELFHSKGRLSSRNEALEEVSKLLFVHVMEVSKGRLGISRESILRQNSGSAGTASALRRYVDSAMRKNYPEKLLSEVSEQEVGLRLKSTEDGLANHIIEIFEKNLGALGSESTSNAIQLDLLNEIFGKFLANSFIDEKQLGQYLTPTEVVEFAVKLALNGLDKSERESLLDPEGNADFGYILDPSCGVGSFLATFTQHAGKQVRDHFGKKGLSEWLKTMEDRTLYGIDKSERMVKLAFTNLALFGHSPKHVYCANSLLNEGKDSGVVKKLHGKVGMILTNPPFGAEFATNDLSGYEIAKHWGDKASSEILFIEQYLRWLRPGGHLIAVLPDSILTNKGPFETLRNYIREQAELEAVVSLPPVTFGAAGTNTKTSIVYLRKRRPRKNHPTYFALCESVGYEVATRDNHRLKIVSGKNELQEVIGDFANIKAGPTFGRMVFDVCDSVRWDATYHATLPLAVEERLRAARKDDLTLSSVAAIAKDRMDPRRMGSGTFKYIEISDVDAATLSVGFKNVNVAEAPSRARKVVRAGDILVSTVRPERRAVAIVPENLDGAVCTTGFAVIRPTSIDSRLLATLLRTDFVTAQIMRNNVGIAYPAIEEHILLDVLLPINRVSLCELTQLSEQLNRIERETLELRSNYLAKVGTLTFAWQQIPKGDPKLPRQSETKSHRQPNKPGSDEHSQGTLNFEVGRTV